MANFWKLWVGNVKNLREGGTFLFEPFQTFVKACLDILALYKFCFIYYSFFLGMPILGAILVMMSDSITMRGIASYTGQFVST